MIPQNLALAGLGMQLLGRNLALPAPVSQNDNGSTHTALKLPWHDDPEGIAFTNTTLAESSVTCYPEDDTDFTPTVPGFSYENCEFKWHEFFGNQGYDTLLHWWSNDGSGQKPAEAVSPSLQAAAINWNPEGCGFVVISSLILDKLVAESQKAHGGRFPEVLKWRSEWGPRDAPHLTKTVDKAFWSDVVEGFRHIFDCIDAGRSGHTRIGESGVLLFFVFRWQLLLEGC